MTEEEKALEELEVFRGEFRKAVESNIFIIISGQDEGPFDVDPFALGLGDEILPDLSSEKTAVIREELHKLLGRTDETIPISTYETGEELSLMVSVFEGKQQDEDGNELTYYLHEINHPDGDLDWQLSANPEPLL